MTIRRIVAACACVALLAGAGADPPKQNPNDGKVAPPFVQRPPVEGGAAGLLARVREAWKGIHAVSYDADVGGADNGRAAPGTTALVSAVRADAGGWMVYVKGETRTKPGEEPTTFEVAYDGVTARALRDREKVVFERTVMDFDEVWYFFSGQGAKQPVPWELLRDKGLDDVVESTIEREELIGSEIMDVLALTFKASVRDGEDNADAGGAPKPADPKAAPTPTGPVLRLWIARGDGLPRRIERERGTTVRVVALNNLNTNDFAKAAPYTLLVPDGYRVRNRDADKRPKRDVAKGADPDGQAPREGWPADPQLLAAGTPAPAFKLKDAHGASRTWSDYKGKVVVMDFWATWCGPCKVAMPAMQKLHEKYKDKQVAVVGFSTDEDPQVAIDFKKGKGYTYDLITGASNLSQDYKVQGIPCFYVVGADGKVVWAATGLQGPPGKARASSKEYTEHLEKTLSTIIDEQLARGEGL